jgi:hypothetical protein
VAKIPPDFYERWLGDVYAGRSLGEPPFSSPPERWLQQIWRHQRLRRGALTTLDGRRVRVLHPGFWNREPGPDFQQALIQYGDEAPQVGSVEIDLEASGWRGHGHNTNPAFASVILHGVWDTPRQSEANLSTVVLKDFLDTPIEEMASWLENEAVDLRPEAMKGQCSAPLGHLETDTLEEILRQAAQFRMKRKAAEFSGWARHCGWDGALYQGLFAALGYKKNAWPMRRLAEIVNEAGRDSENRDAWEARLLGLAGFLPAEIPRTDAGAYAKRLWDIWWRERDRWLDVALPKSAWVMAGVRPVNHPQRRLALAARWLASGDVSNRVQEWLISGSDAKGASKRLMDILGKEGGEFWPYHATLQSRRLAKAQPLLGEGRSSDMAVNVVFPWLWARAEAGRNAKLQRRIEGCLDAVPAGEDNAVLKLARARLFARPRSLPRLAFIQQGLLQIVRDFCAHSDSLCSQCRFPELLRMAQA